MNKLHAFRAAKLATALLAVFATALPATAGDGVPFKGVSSAAITLVVPDGDNLLLTVTGTGQATHLGRFTRLENLTLHPDGAIDGDLTLTAANGAKVFGDVAGGFTSAPGVVPVPAAGTCAFTGGAGRLSGASGGYQWSGVSFDGQHFTLIFEGDITF